MGLFELYILIGTVFACLDLLAIHKLDEELRGIDILIAVITIFAWLPFLIYFAIGWIKDYRKLNKQTDEEFWNELVKRALEKAQEEVKKEGGDKK